MRRIVSQRRDGEAISGKAKRTGGANVKIAWRAERKALPVMDDLFFGEGWLGELLKVAGVPVAVKDTVRERMQELSQSGEVEWEKEWDEINGLLDNNKVGPALEKAMASLSSTVELLSEALGEKSEELEKPFSPFLVKRREIKKILHPQDDVEELVNSHDDLEAVISLEMINDARRLLASWGAGVWGEETLEIIPRLEEDLEELRKTQASMPGEDDLAFDDIEKEIELADRFATMATRFAGDLMDLHILNARNPEVRMRFSLLWGTVRNLELDKDTPAAAFEALQVLEEALEMAGLGGGEMLQRVDLLYDTFTDAEDLRKAVDHLVTVSRDGEGTLEDEQGSQYIEVIYEALGDIGLEV